LVPIEIDWAETFAAAAIEMVALMIAMLKRRGVPRPADALTDRSDLLFVCCHIFASFMVAEEAKPI
jgi:hypothetical protein